MPIIPTHKPQVGQNISRTSGGVQSQLSASPVDFGAQEAADLSNFAQVIQRESVAQIDRRNKSDLLEADNDFQTKAREINLEAQRKKGKNAEGAVKQAEQDLKDARATIYNNMATPAQKRAFDNSATRTNMDTLFQIKKHEVAQSMKTLEINEKASIYNIGQGLKIKFSNQPNNYYADTLGAIKEIEKKSFNTELSEEANRAKSSQRIQNMHIDNLKVLSVDNPALAKAYMEQFKKGDNAISSDITASFAKTVDANAVRQQAGGLAFAGKEMDSVAFNEQLHKDGVSEEVISKAMITHRGYRSDIKSKKDVVNGEVKAGYQDAVNSSPFQPLFFPADMDTKTKVEVENYQKAKQKEANSGKAISTDVSYYNELQNEILVHPEKITKKQRDNGFDKSRLSTGDLKHFNNEANKINSEPNKRVVMQQLQTSLKAQRNWHTFNGLGDQADIEERTKLAYEAFNAEWDQLEIDQRTNPAEIQRIVEKLTVEMEWDSQGYIWDSNKFGYEIPFDVVGEEPVNRPDNVPANVPWDEESGTYHIPGSEEWYTAVTGTSLFSN